MAAPLVPLAAFFVPLVLGLLVATLFIPSQGCFRRVVGFVFGAVLYTLLIGQFDRTYRPFGSDAPAWIWMTYVAPTGATLGSMTALSIGLDKEDKRWWIGATCLLAAALLLGAYYHVFTSTMESRPNQNYARSEAAPALLWSALLFLRGLWLVGTGVQKARSSRDDVL